MASFIDRQGCELRTDKPGACRIRVRAADDAQARQSAFLMSRKRPMEMKKRSSPVIFGNSGVPHPRQQHAIQRFLRFPLSSAARCGGCPAPFLLYAVSAAAVF
jgi:hypothetical protein